MRSPLPSFSVGWGTARGREDVLRKCDMAIHISDMVSHSQATPAAVSVWDIMLNLTETAASGQTPLVTISD